MYVGLFVFPNKHAHFYKGNIREELEVHHKAFPLPHLFSLRMKTHTKERKNTKRPASEDKKTSGRGMDKQPRMSRAHEVNITARIDW